MNKMPIRAWNEELARKTYAPYVAIEGGLLPALHALQDEFGFISKPAIVLLADAFNITRAEVFGVVTFYHDFRLDKPAGRRTLKLCRAEACQAVGSEELAEVAKQRLGVSWGETTLDGEWSLLPVFCLGLCACGPCAVVGEMPYARLDKRKLCSLLDEPTP